MMRVTVIEDPKPSQAKVRFQAGGEWCTCYIQGDAWESSECEQLYADWSRTPGALSHFLAERIEDDALPWHGATADPWQDSNSACAFKDTLSHKAPEGLWVGFRLAPKRTRNPKCFRGIRYFVAWRPGSAPPCSEVLERRFLFSPPVSAPAAPAASDVPLPFGLA